MEAVRYGVGGFAGADAVDYGGAFLYNFKTINYDVEQYKVFRTKSEITERTAIKFLVRHREMYPNIEILSDLATVLHVSADEILAGSERDADGLSYSKAGVDIAYTDTIKKEMSRHLETGDRRVLNGLGPFASLYDINFPEMKNPVLVLKSESGYGGKTAGSPGYNCVRECGKGHDKNIGKGSFRGL